MNIVWTISLFLIAGVAEIGGAYLIWQWVRAGKPLLWSVLGLAALFIYSLTQTLQVFNFGRVFAAYGGVFITWPCCGAGGSMAAPRIAGIGLAWESVWPG